ncbi:MAG: FAD-dependent oxidoreductase [Patescibacteria group bacterium]
MRYLIQNIKKTCEDIIVLDLMPALGEKIINFLPGQYAMLAFYDEYGKLTSPHAFSISSSPEEVPLIQFGIKIKGSFTQSLAKLTPGKEIFVYGPYGTFIFNPDTDQSAVFIAGGVGITPLLSSIRYAANKKLPNELILVYSSRNANTILYYEEIKKLEADNPNFKAFFAVTDSGIPDGQERMINERVSAKIISAALKNQLYGKTFFLCGPEPFMKAISDDLKNLGVPRQFIKTEAFSMIPALPLKENLLNLALIYGGSAALMVAITLWIYNIESVRATDNPYAKTDLLYSLQQMQELQKNMFKEQTSAKPPATPPVNEPPTPAYNIPAVPAPSYTPPAPAVNYQTTIKPRTTVS